VSELGKGIRNKGLGALIDVWSQMVKAKNTERKRARAREEAGSRQVPWRRLLPRGDAGEKSDRDAPLQLQADRLRFNVIR
jgi:hypothetical protein